MALLYTYRLECKSFIYLCSFAAHISLLYINFRASINYIIWYSIRPFTYINSKLNIPPVSIYYR